MQALAALSEEIGLRDTAIEMRGAGAGPPCASRSATRADACTIATALVALVVTSACGPPRSAPPPGAAAANASPAAARGGDLTSNADRVRLAALTAERSGTSMDAGYRIGADDLLDIRIPDLLDAQQSSSSARPSDTAGPPTVAAAPAFQQGFRVSGHGEISMPMLGLVRVEGLTPNELEQALADRLRAAGILRTPQVSVQVVEYRSRVVAVIGSVERPGLYPITRPGATIADLMWAAGGPAKDAGRLVEFAPARGDADAARAALAMQTSGGADPSRAALAMQQTAGGATPAPLLVSAREYDRAAAAVGAPIRFDLDLLTHATGADARDLNPPVRPGDVISLAAAGTVHVDGWVDKPGSYPVTRGMTVSGAIAAAGGHLFPADQANIQVKRVMGAGEEQTFKVDLAAVAEGHAMDVPITDGDVVQVPASNGMLLPYGAWTLVREVIHIGGTVPLF